MMSRKNVNNQLKYVNETEKPEKPEMTEKPDRRMPVWALVVMDVLLTCFCLCIFALYHHVLPRHLNNEEIVVATAVEGEDTTFRLPVNSDGTDNGQENSNNQTGDNSTDTNITDSSITDTSGTDNGITDTSGTDNGITDTSGTDNATTDTSGTDNSATGTSVTDNAASVSPAMGTSVTDSDKKQTDKNAGKTPDGGYYNYGNSDTTDIYADNSEISYISSGDKTVTRMNSYSSDNIQFVTDKVELGSGSNKITYYVSDIYITNVKYLKTAFAYGEYGKNIKESTLDMATDNNALLAINGDYYGNNEIGVVIRNGILYRSEVYDADLCVLYTDGTMETYSPEKFNLDDVIARGAWQAWIFGPELLDGQGNILTKFNSTYYLSNAHPRTAIGYVEPGHYVFALVDGRVEGYSRGVTLTELAQIMKDAGCVTAYNLDGGKSSEMVYEEDFVNKPWEGGRSVSDIIYIGE